MTLTLTDRRAALRARLSAAVRAQQGVLAAPGVADAFEARMVQQAGFEAIYVSGAAVANKLLGMPDLGQTTAGEMADTLARICDVTELPVIADADTGYGNALNVQRTVRAYARAGVAAMHLEDQVFPKRCGHFDGKQVIDAREAAQKIRAAVDARTDPNLLIIARTDALAVHGMADALMRANLYGEAGADLLFIDALEDRDQIEAAPGRVNRPLLFNMVEGARTPQVSHAELTAWGYAVVIHPSMLLRVQAMAAQQALQTLRRTGGSAAVLDTMLSFPDRQQIVDLPAYQARERRYSAENA